MSFRPSPPVLFLGLAAVLAGPADAASLRLSTMLSGPNVRLCDLFDDAGEQASRVLGPGPAPGARLVIEAPQLEAIARQFGVEWRPGSGADHTVLERPGRPVPREAVLAALKDSLASAYPLPGQLEIDLPGFTAPMLGMSPPGKAAKPDTPYATVDTIDTDPATGRFVAQMSATGTGPDQVQFRVVGVARQLVQLPVLTRRMAAGEVIQLDDVRIAGVPVAIVQAAVARTPAQAAGLAARRQLLPGQPIPLADLGQPMMVLRGGTMMLALDVGSLSVSAQGVAMESGGMGEHVRVLNTSSRAIVDAEITGVGHGRVLPGSVSILPAGHSTVPPRTAAQITAASLPTLSAVAP